MNRTPKATSIVLLVAAYPRRAQATRAARELVARGVLACATVASGAKAFYRWEGRTHEEASVTLWGKTSSRRAAAAMEAIRALHPDRVPEILLLRAGALPAYAAWVASETKRTSR
jgi:periplasmic divalent cation tolerance protein